MTKRTALALRIIIVVWAVLIVLLQTGLLHRHNKVPKSIQSSQFPQENGLHWFLVAVERMPKLDEWYNETSNTYFENGWRDDTRMIDQIERCRPSFEAIRKGIEVGNVKFSPQEFGDPEPYLDKWRELARLMTLQGMMQASREDYEAVIDQFNAVLDFGSESTGTGSLIAHLAGNAMQGIGMRQLCKVLKAPGVTAEQCRAVGAHLDALHQKAPALADAIGREADSLELWSQRRPSLQDFYTDFVKAVSDTGEAEQLAGSATPEQCRRLLNETVASIREAAPMFDAPFYVFDNIACQQLAAGNALSKYIVDSYHGLPECETRCGMQRVGTRLVAAIEEYRRENGVYPDTLDALVPSILPQLPNDPFSGLSFRYAKQFDDYRLYSVGANLRDDGGAGSPWDCGQDDYVIAGQD